MSDDQKQIDRLKGRRLVLAVRIAQFDQQVEGIKDDVLRMRGELACRLADKLARLDQEYEAAKDDIRSMRADLARQEVGL